MSEMASHHQTALLKALSKRLRVFDPGIWRARDTVQRFLGHGIHSKTSPVVRWSQIQDMEKW